MLLYVLSLRGNEPFMLEVAKLLGNLDLKEGLVWFPLVGKLKGDSSPETYYLRAVELTSSGINVRWWRDSLVTVLRIKNRTEGPAICDEDGFLLPSSDVNECLWEVLEDIYEQDTSLFPKDIRTSEDIREKIKINRSGRRSAESRAVDKGLKEMDYKVVNRWPSDYNAKGKSANHPLTLSYTDQARVSGCFRRFTEAIM